MVRSRLDHGVLHEPVPGVLVLAGARPTLEQRVAIALLASTPGSVASHRTAGALHGLEGFQPGPVELSIQGSGSSTDRSVRLHRVAALEPADRFEVEGLAVTGLARTLADLGSVVGDADVLRALDDARRRGVSLRWLRSTAERLHRPGQRGTGTLLRLLDGAEQEAVAPDSWLERLVEAIIAVPGLPRFERQHVIRDPLGRFVARTDGAFPAIRLGIEAHSRRFHFGAAPEARDEDRDLRVAAAGWELLYLGWQHTKRPTAMKLFA
jgi:hypothetical protein